MHHCNDKQTLKLLLILNKKCQMRKSTIELSIALPLTRAAIMTYDISSEISNQNLTKSTDFEYAC